MAVKRTRGTPLTHREYTVGSLIHVLRQPTFLFSSLFSAITVDLPPSRLVKAVIA